MFAAKPKEEVLLAGVKSIFVPGRVCLLGEHTDWASQYYRKKIDKGQADEKGEAAKNGTSPIHNPYGHCLVFGTGDLGIYARVSLNNSDSSGDGSSDDAPFHVRTTSYDGVVKSQSFPWDAKDLRAIAQEGGYFSYICGVAAHMLSHPVYGATVTRKGPLKIVNHLTTLPQGKGLSSSAAVCVLVVQAFNQLCELGMDTDAVMLAAYEGEILTPSRCGRMDQCVAYGSCCVSMDFDHGVLTCTKVEPKLKEKERNQEGKNSNDNAPKIYFVVADLNCKKDTVRILTDLRRAFEEEGSGDDCQDAEVQRKLRAAGRDFLGTKSLYFSKKAQEAVASQDAEKLGHLMNECQTAFRSALQPLCPSELASPKLYKVLSHPKVTPLVFGGKGVGSQGDGTVQFVARSLEAQRKLCEVLKSEELDCSPYPMTL